MQNKDFAPSGYLSVIYWVKPFLDFLGIFKGAWRALARSRQSAYRLCAVLRPSRALALLLKQVQQHVTELTCAVMNTVTHMGWQFPGSPGPGNPIFEK